MSVLRRWTPLIVGLGLIVPGPRAADAQGSGADSLRMSWTAPGDDGTTGTATRFEMRISTTPITAANWNGAALVPGMPTPGPSGTAEQVMVHGLSRDTTYYLALRSVDDVGNWSALSNVARWDWSQNSVPPAAPTGLTAAQEGAKTQLQWNPNHESNLAGYSVYRATAVGGPWQKLNAALVLAAEFLDSNLPANITTLWYEASALNTAGIEGPPSSAVRVDLTTVVLTPPTWAVSAAFPNPSTSTQTVCIPIAVPSAGAGNAALDILDEGGRLVRHLLLAGATPCAAGGVVWDGRNDAGRSVTPGVYSALLIAAGEPRAQTRLVRQP
jgi:hypothetical protein